MKADWKRSGGKRLLQLYEAAEMSPLGSPLRQEFEKVRDKYAGELLDVQPPYSMDAVLEKWAVQEKKSIVALEPFRFEFYDPPFLSPSIDTSLFQGIDLYPRLCRFIQNEKNKFSKALHFSFYRGLEREFSVLHRSVNTVAQQQRCSLRDIAMVEKIDTLLRSSDPNNIDFIAVGAAHLVGEEGICALLRQKGWKVHRVTEKEAQSS